MNIVDHAIKANEIIVGEDGFYFYWPDRRGGYTAANLRELADELDRRNAAWQAVIDNDPALTPTAGNGRGRVR